MHLAQSLTQVDPALRLGGLLGFLVVRESCQVQGVIAASVASGAMLVGQSEIVVIAAHLHVCNGV